MKRVFLLLSLFTCPAFAEHIYLNQSGTGDGTSAAQAKAAYTFWNNAANWDTLVNTTNGKIGPGDTVHIVGILTPAAGSIGTTSNQLYFQGSGTPGNPITLKFDAGGQIRHPTGTTTGLIYSAGGLHDVVIEGANGTVAMNTGAFVQKDIEIYDNGTNLANQVTGTSAVIITGAGDNITIKNLYMFGSYQRAKNHTSDHAGDGNLASVRGLNNLIYDNCRAEFGEGGLGLSSQGNTSGYRITNNYVYGCSTAIKLGTQLGGLNQGAVITGNALDGFAYWAGIQSPGQYHCDGIQTITAGGGSGFGNSEHRNYTIAYNRIGPDLGLYGSFNAHIFLEDNVNGMFIYNNLLTANSTPTNPLQGNAPPGTANGFITGGTAADYFSQPSAIRSLVANNTILGGGSGQGISTGFAECRGNIISNVTTMISVWQQQQPSATHGQYLISDKNVFYHPSGTYGFGMTMFAGGSLSCSNFACWQSHENILAQNGGIGFDLNSITQNPLATFPTGVLSAGSPAIGFAPTQSVFSNDLVGATRTVPWDAGALEYNAVADTTAPAPNPMTFSSAPAAVDAFSVTMTASTASDAGGTVSYFFDETSGAAGGTDSGWQTNPVYIDSGLSPSTLYTYRVKARDPSMNETSYSSGANATTPTGPGGTVNIETLNVGNLRVGQ